MFGASPDLRQSSLKLSSEVYVTISKTIATSQDSVNKCSLDSKVERAYMKGALAMYEFLQEEKLIPVITTGCQETLLKKFKEKNS